MLSKSILSQLRFNVFPRVARDSQSPQDSSATVQETVMGERINADYPPFSRVFVVCSKNHREEEVRKAFEAYGSVEDVWMVKDRMTKESKGICYVKYDKASSAAMAIESLDGKTIGEEQKPIRVSRVALISSW